MCDVSLIRVSNKQVKYPIRYVFFLAVITLSSQTSLGMGICVDARLINQLVALFCVFLALLHNAFQASSEILAKNL